MTVFGRLSGATTDTSATVGVRVSPSSTVRIAYSGDMLVTAPSYTGPVVADSQGHAHVPLSGLPVGQRCYFKVEENGALDATVGSLLTHPAAPGSPADFEFAFGACSRYPTARVFDTLHTHQPLFFLHTGDLHYAEDTDGLDIGGPDPVAYRTAYRTATETSRAATFYSNTALVEMHDDHDSLGNDAWSGLPNWDVALAERNRVFPTYPRPDPTARYQAFDVGRVRFIVLDERTHRDKGYGSGAKANDDPTKTMLGATQKAWLFDQLEAAAVDPSVALSFLVSPQAPGNGVNDGWGNFEVERREIFDKIDEVDLDLIILAGDTHGCGFRWVNYSTSQRKPVRVWLAAPLEAAPSTISSYSANDDNNPYEGYMSSSGMHGWVKVEDSGTGIRATFTGWRTRHFGGQAYPVSTDVQTFGVPPGRYVVQVDGGYADIVV